MKGINCAELLKSIPNEVFESIGKETNVDYQTKRLTGKIMFKLILFSLLNTERISLRVMENLFHTEQFQIFSDKYNKKKTRHSSLAERFSQINFEFFQKIFEYLKDKFKGVFRSKNVKKNIDIIKIDSTLINLSANLLDFGMKGVASAKGGGKKEIKFTVSLKNKLPFDVETFIHQKDLSEESPLKKAVLRNKNEENSVIIFDRGLQRRKSFVEFSDEEIQFVTRLKNQVRFKKIRDVKDVNGRKSNTLRLISDEIVYLKDETGKFIEKEFRLIVGKSLETGEEIKFLTNITDLNAREITDIYKERWGIEMFFRFIKQELNFKHFISRSLNGVKVMLYMTLITALLLLIYKEKNNIEGYKIAKLRFALELEMELTKDLIILCGGDISKLSKYRKPVPS